MTLAANSYDEHVAERILEFCEDSTQWSRRLWGAGTILIARELLEAGDPSIGASEHAMKTLQSELIARVMQDPAACARSDRSATTKMLAGPVTSLVKPGHAWHVLNTWTSTTRNNYLLKWATALRTASDLPSAECAARLIAAHLLDEGFSQKYLHRWLTFRIKHSSDVHTLPDMCEELHAFLARGPQAIEVLVPLAAQIALPRPIPEGWLTPQQVRDWRAANVPNWSPIRQHGAVLLSVEALDIYAAGDIARDRVTAIRDRFRVGGRREIAPAGELWVSGVEAPQPTQAPPRRVEVYAFERQSALWSHSVKPDLEAAMELMAPLERGPTPAATTGAWAAIESLLVGPGDDAKHLAGERFALILAGGHLRAELTSLAWAHTHSTADTLSADLRSMGSNQERAEHVLAHLVGGGNLTLARPQDVRALKRARAVLADPHRYVDGVRGAIEPAIRALYRQRNLLSHAGGTSGVAIKPTIERTAPLVAAGMDRIAHVALTSGHSALELAALARVRHEALRGQLAAAALSLLEI